MVLDHGLSILGELGGVKSRACEACMFNVMRGAHAPLFAPLSPG